jgi:formylglycine-generating enzyme required for sulfatase activity
MTTGRKTLASWYLVFVGVIAAFLSAAALADDIPKADKPAPDPMVGKEPGQVRDDNGLKMKLVWCPPGFVTMEQSVYDKNSARRSDQGTTPARVFLTYGYWLGKYEVTQAEWKEAMAAEPWKGQRDAKEGDDFPATFVSWDDAMEFCRRLTEQERNADRLREEWEYTLPTEAQWESACRARTESKFSFGDDEAKLGEYAWIWHNTESEAVGEAYAHRVGQKLPNRWGLHDMHGNVWEWCRDWWSVKMPRGRNPEVTERNEKTFRVIRGGSWTNGADYCESASHNGITQSFRHSSTGFRVALTPVRPENQQPDPP